MLTARAIISKLIFVLYMGVSSVLIYLRVSYFCWLSSASVSYHSCVAILQYLRWNTVFYKDQSVFGIVTSLYVVITMWLSFQTVLFCFTKSNFILRSLTPLCLSLFSLTVSSLFSLFDVSDKWSSGGPPLLPICQWC